MRLKFLNIVTILLLAAGSSDSRPQQLEVSENVQSKVENDDVEGWRPVQHDVKITQESIPVGKDLPQIVEGNSRYTEERGARRRKSYIRNNPFYEDHIQIFSQEKTIYRGYEPLDPEAFESRHLFKRSNLKEDIRQQVNDEVMITNGNNSDVKISTNFTIGRNKIEGTPIKIINLKNDKQFNRITDDRKKFHFMIDEVSANVESSLTSGVTDKVDNNVSILEDKNVLDAYRSINPPNIHRTKISSNSRGQIKSSSLLLKHLSNVDSRLSLNRILGNKSETRMDNLRKIRPQVTLYSRVNSEGYKPIHVNKEKVMNFYKILPTHNDLKNFTNKTTFLQSNLHNLHDIQNQVFGTGLDNSKTEIKQSESSSNQIGIGVHRLAINQTSKHGFVGKNSTNNRIRIKPQVNGSLFYSVIKDKDRESSDEEHSKNSPKNSIRTKPNLSQNIPVLNLKNWPNDNLQNIEDLYNYQKYTSFNNKDDNSEEQENSDDLAPHETSSNVHKVIEKPDKNKMPRPAVLIFDHSLAPPLTVQNSEADPTNSYDPETHVNIEQSPQEVMQWEQIHQFTSNNTNFLITDRNEADSNVFDPIPEDLEPNRPLSPDHGHTQSPNYYGYVDDISIGENPPLDIGENYNDDSVQDGEYYQNQNDQTNFEYPNLENDFNPGYVTRPVSETIENDETHNVYQNDPVYTPVLSKQPYFNPLSVVSQNTVVHILNAGKKRPNITVTEMKVSPNHSEALLDPEKHSADNKNSSGSTPNVHIMFTTDEDKDEVNGPQYGLPTDQRIPEVIFDDGINCPTIKINSYTRINNTIQGKEGCTDLNIIINSHVLNTNVFNPATTSTGNYGIDNKSPSENYPENGQAQPSYTTSVGDYVISDGSYGMFPTGNEQNTGGLVPGDLQDFPVIEGQNPQGNLQGVQYIQQSPGTSTFEVFQQTQINVGSQDDDSLNSGDALDPGVSNDPTSLGDEADTVPETDVLNDPATPPEVANDPAAPEVLGDPVSGGGAPGVLGDPVSGGGAPGVLGDPVSGGGAPGVLGDPVSDGGAPGVLGDPVSGGGTPSFPPLDGIQGPLADAGPVDIAADAPSPATGGSSGIQSPGGISNPLSGVPGQLQDFVGNLGPSQSGNGDSPGSLLGGGDDDDGDDDDDADDDLIDLMPFSIMESVTSILPYFTLLNPLNYGFLSIAISPLAVAVAGLFGLAAFVPFALPSIFNFGRSFDQNMIRFKPSLEELVTRSIEQYKNWNEWKSKRKKRKR